MTRKTYLIGIALLVLVLGGCAEPTPTPMPTPTPTATATPVPTPIPTATPTATPTPTPRGAEPLTLEEYIETCGASIAYYDATSTIGAVLDEMEREFPWADILPPEILQEHFTLVLVPPAVRSLMGLLFPSNPPHTPSSAEGECPSPPAVIAQEPGATSLRLRPYSGVYSKQTSTGALMELEILL